MQRRTILGVCAALFSLTFSFAVATTRVAATDPTPEPQAQTDVNASLKGGFAEVSGWVTKSAETVPADKYNYRPTEDVRTFGQLVAHIADSYNYFCTNGAGTKVQWSDPVEKGTIDKATLVAKLKQATDSCNTVYGSGTGQFRPLFTNLGHTSLHYGNIITYMRMMGLKPPSS
jgi:hypothetical protein